MTSTAVDAATPATPPTSAAQPSHQRFYWTRHTEGDGAWWRETDASTGGSAGGPPGADLAALRRGIGRQPGAVSTMWPFYATLTEDGRLTPLLFAEHVALTLFAVHQQSRTRPAHRVGVGVGTAVRALRDSDRFSVDAVDRRFAAAATATSLTEVGVLLRGLVTQLRGIDADPGLDYTRLTWDLRDWQDPERLVRVRRRWGAQYFAWRADRAPEEPAAP